MTDASRPTAVDGLRVTIVPPGPPIDIPWLTYEQAVAEHWPEDCRILMASFRRRGGIPRPELNFQLGRWNRRNPQYPMTHFARLPDEIPHFEARES